VNGDQTSINTKLRNIEWVVNFFIKSILPGGGGDKNTVHIQGVDVLKGPLKGKRTGLDVQDTIRFRGKLI